MIRGDVQGRGERDTAEVCRGGLPGSKCGLPRCTFSVPAMIPRDETPFACNLTALSPAERAEHHRLGAIVLEAIRSRREIADGYAFELEGSRVAIGDLAAWAGFERRCCPFFGFQLEFGSEGGPVTLRLTGRAGVKDFIRSEFERAFR